MYIHSDTVSNRSSSHRIKVMIDQSVVDTNLIPQR